MRNLKKVLSLVLCMAMMLSIMVVGAGAAFKDQETIVNEEAVEFCVALGIINGRDTGEFDPSANITRAESTKLIAIAMNGEEPVVVDAGKSSFSDVLTSNNSKWANKFIEYGVAAGFVAGMGDGTFAPDANVTGSQLSKMLLVALGKDAVENGYVGSGWELKVNVDATKAGLYAGLNIDPTAALSRDDAAQMIWNALNVNMGRGKTLLGSVFNAEVVSGIMEGGIDYNYDTGVYTYSISGWAYDSEADYGDLFAMNVKALVKDGDILTMMVNKGGVVAEGALGDFDPTDYNFDNSPSFRPTVNVVEFNRYETFGPRSFEGQDGRPFNLAPYYGYRAIDIDGGGDIDTIVVYPYTVLKVIDVDSDSFSVRAMESKDAKLIANPNTLGLTGRDIKAKNVEVIGTLEANGYAMAIPAQNTLKHLKTYIDLDIQTGTVDKLNTVDTLMTIDGVEYNGACLEMIKAFEDISVGSSYSFVEVNGYLFMVDGAGVVESNYALVTDVAANTTGTTAKVWATELLLTTGESVTVNATAPATVGSLYTYTVNASGNYVLNAVTGGSYEANTSIYDTQEAYSDYYDFDGANLSQTTKWAWQVWNKTSGGANRYGEDANDNAYFLAGDENVNTKHYVNDDAVIFVYYSEDDKYDVISGADLADADVFGTACWAFTGANDTYNTYSYVELGYVALPHDIDEVVYNAYVDSVDGRSYTVDGVTYYYTEVTVILPGGEKITVKTDASENQKDPLSKAAYRMDEGKIYTITLLNDAIVHIELDEGGTPEALTLTHAIVTKTASDKLDLEFPDNASLNGTYLITSDTEIYDLDNVGITGLQESDDVYVIVAGNELTTLLFND